MFLLYNFTQIQSSEWIELLITTKKEKDQMKLRAIIALSSAALLTMVFALVSGAGAPPCGIDADSDGVGDCVVDNCLGLANASQHDPDEDGYGTACDSDINNNCFTGVDDAFTIFAAAGAAAPWVPTQDGAMDLNENDFVGVDDAFAAFAVAGAQPGPSARLCAACTGANPGSCPNI